MPLSVCEATSRGGADAEWPRGKRQEAPDQTCWHLVIPYSQHLALLRPDLCQPKTGEAGAHSLILTQACSCACATSAITSPLLPKDVVWRDSLASSTILVLLLSSLSCSCGHRHASPAPYGCPHAGVWRHSPEWQTVTEGRPSRHQSPSRAQTPAFPRTTSELLLLQRAFGLWDAFEAVKQGEGCLGKGWGALAGHQYASCSGTQKRFQVTTRPSMQQKV